MKHFLTKQMQFIGIEIYKGTYKLRLDNVNILFLAFRKFAFIKITHSVHILINIRVICKTTAQHHKIHCIYFFVLFFIDFIKTYAIFRYYKIV